MIGREKITTKKNKKKRINIEAVYIHNYNDLFIPAVFLRTNDRF